MRVEQKSRPIKIRPVSCGLIIFLALAVTVMSQRTLEAPKTPGLSGEEQIRVQTDLVSFFVTVTDSHGKHVAGLDKNAFTVTDDKVKQQIIFFSAADAPVSIGIIFDLSGSMTEDGIKRAHEALAKFFETSDSRDEFFLVGFSSSAEVLVDRTRDPNLIQRSLTNIKPHGDTALFDAVRLGVEKVARGTHPKRALLLISDGDENHSRYTFKEVRRMLAESDATLYSVWVWNGTLLASKAGARIRNTLNGLSEVTGGRAFYPSSSVQMEQVFDQIAVELRHQYSIGYRPTNFVDDGRWHHVSVKVAPSASDSHLVVRSRRGYFALTRVGRTLPASGLGGFSYAFE
jgi:Ca-activated chloride channel homolog